eukprot:COSAG02_NODE_65963_length_256_cov_1.611465_2_plen_24_part_01
MGRTTLSPVSTISLQLRLQDEENS